MENRKQIRVAILGGNGMLGRMVWEVALEEDDLVVCSMGRQDLDVDSDYNMSLELEHSCLIKFRPHYIINCIGAIKPAFVGDLTQPIFTNAVFPRTLAKWCGQKGIKLIHITTDCVFSGAVGGYSEEDPHDPLDEYGKSKSLGEPSDCMVIRTSIIGPEWGGNKKSLVEWLLSKRGEEVTGFIDHYWNGLTTEALASAIFKIMREGLYENGTFHIYTNSVSKLKLLTLMNDEWGLNIKVNAARAPSGLCDRTMRTAKTLNEKLNIPDMKRMIKNLRPYIEADRSA